MTMWIVIMWAFIALVAASFFYIGIRVPLFFDFANSEDWTGFRQFSLGLLITVGVAGMIAFCIDYINALVCVMYVAMIWAFSDFVFWLIQKLGNITFEHYYAGYTALIVSIAALSFGWYSVHRVWQTDYILTTEKDIPNLKIAMFADSHVGTTFNAEGFAFHLQKIQEQNPDIAFVVGDYVDDGTDKKNMIEATRALGKLKTKYGTYYVAGNHDKGYYASSHRGFSEYDLINELTANGIKVLRDDVVLIDDAFYIIGRRDFSEVREIGGKRRSMAELVSNLDKNKYIIVLDHQPADYENQAKAEVDLVLNGHTHGGQLFPFNWVGKWIKANDLVYGHEKRKKTDFIVTSGISDWAIKFKTGTKSEFVIININKNKTN